jgi:outer membrane protease
MRYGINKQEGREARKTDDQFQVSSNFGYKKDSLSNWYYAGRFNFQTQFANGYAYPNVDLAISKPFAPAYIFLGVGSEYSRKDLKLNLYLSPLTQKTTLVFDQRRRSKHTRWIRQRTPKALECCYGNNRNQGTGRHPARGRCRIG